MLVRVVILAALLSSCSASSTGTTTPSSADASPNTEPSTASTECRALYGPEPWLVLFQGTRTVACVSVAEHQDVQVWNKGYDETIVEWIDGRRVLPSDSSFATGRIGDVLDPGAHDFQGSPYPLPTIRVVAADESAAASRPTAVVETGMTLGEARRAYGLDLVIDPDLMPGPTCWLAVVPGDPYSPLFILRGSRTDEAVVVDILASSDQSSALYGERGCDG